MAKKGMAYFMNLSPLYTTNPKIAICSAGNKGKGVFALEDIGSDELIERVPILIIPASFDYEILNVDIGNYMFEWSNNSMAIALGYGSMYNHSYSPNAFYEKKYKEKSIEFVALRKINRGEEILVNYNGKPHDLSKIWFMVQE